MLYHDAKTVLELFQRGMGLNTGRSCLRVVEKTTEGIVNNEISYEHVWQTATKFARGIVVSSRESLQGKRSGRTLTFYALDLYKTVKSTTVGLTD